MKSGELLGDSLTSVTILLATGVTFLTRYALVGVTFSTLVIDSLTGAILAVLVAEVRLRVAIKSKNLGTL